jgi:probable F420-dependent oxidoreductase
MKIETDLPLGRVDPGVRSPGERFRPDDVPAQARLLEELGYDGFSTTETKTDPFITTTLAGTTTERLRLATAVAIAFPRSPTSMALSAWTVQQASAGRFVLGLGTQVKGHIERRYGMTWSAPQPWLRDYVGAVRAVWHAWQHGTPLDYHSEHYTLTLMNPLFDPGPIDWPGIPIHLAAVGAGMGRLAGEVADGMRPHPICTRRYLAEVLHPAIAAGAATVRRDPASVEVVASPLIATGPDRAAVQKATSDVRARISFYASTRTYRAVFDTHGWSDVADQLSVLSREQRWTEMERHVTDEMVETIAVIGTHDEIAEKVWRRYDGVADAVEFGLPVTSPADRERLGAAISAMQKGFA